MDLCKSLFKEIKIGDVLLSNRIVHGPATTNMGGNNGEIISQTVEYYRTRAEGGPGLVITEATYVSNESKAYPRQIGVDRDELIPGLKQLAEAIHVNGAKVFLQLCHSGNKASSKISGEQPICASPIARIGGEMPREMTEEDILNTIDKFAVAANRAKEAGFDGVDIHAGHGNLPIAFYSPLNNKRKDSWNGSLENRAKFLVEIVRRIKETTGESFPVSVKISAEEFVEDGFHLEEAKELVKMLVEVGADAICAYGGAAGDVSHRDLSRAHEFAGNLPLGVKDGPMVYLAEEIKKVTDVPVMTVGRVNNPEFAASVINEGKADLIQVSRGFIADPKWAKKVKSGDFDLIRPCIACSNGCYSGIALNKTITCAVNPRVGLEYLGFEKASEAKKVLVIGGGASGLQAAITATQRGHFVTLIEASDKLCGQLNIAATPPDKDRIGLLCDYLIKEALRLGVNIKTETKADLDMIKEIGIDNVIIATGAQPIRKPSFEVECNVKIYNAWDILEGEKVVEKNLAVIGGGVVGCEVADYLSTKDHTVTIIEMLEELMADDFYKILPGERTVLLEKLKQNGVSSYVSSKVLKATESEIKVAKGNESFDAQAEAIVMAVGATPTAPEGIEELDEKVKVTYVGDCVKVGKIHDAIESGYKAGMEV